MIWTFKFSKLLIRRIRKIRLKFWFRQLTSGIIPVPDVFSYELSGGATIEHRCVAHLYGRNSIG